MGLIVSIAMSISKSGHLMASILVKPFSVIKLLAARWWYLFRWQKSGLSCHRVDVSVEPFVCIVQCCILLLGSVDAAQ